LGYKEALDNAWEKIESLGSEERVEVRFLGDTYTVDPTSKQVLSSSCNIPPHDHISILILHYIIKKIQGMPKVSEKWISFQELPGGKGYYGAFRKRAIGPITRKYGDNPSGIFDCLNRLPASKSEHGDAGIVVQAFDGVPVLITVFGKDEEFSSDANIHFDESVSKVFSTEDAAVLADTIGRLL